MKTSLKFLLVVLVVGTILYSCQKADNKISYTGGTNPVLTANQTQNSVPLSFVTKDQPAITLSWTNPNYKFSTGLSSQDVSYSIEIDTTGSNFTNPNRKTLQVSKDLSTTILQTDLNDYLLNTLTLAVSVPHNIEIRVTSTLVNSNVPLTSNTLKFTVTPYAIPPKVAPPASGQLYLVGSATAGGWNNPVPVPTQKFTQISPTIYEITIALTGGQEYLILPINGDWSHKYSVADKTVPGLNTGGDFKLDASDNIPGPSVSGNYLIHVDFQRGKFTVTKL